MPHVRVFDFLQHLGRFQRKSGRRINDHLLLPHTHPSRSAFHGLFIAVLMAAGFWAALAMLILRLR